MGTEHLHGAINFSAKTENSQTKIIETCAINGRHLKYSASILHHSMPIEVTAILETRR